METGIGERVVGGMVAFVILFFCAYFIGQALDGLDPHTAEQAPSPLLDYRTIGDSI